MTEMDTSVCVPEKRCRGYLSSADSRCPFLHPLLIPYAKELNFDGRFDLIDRTSSPELSEWFDSKCAFTGQELTAHDMRPDNCPLDRHNPGCELTWELTSSEGIQKILHTARHLEESVDKLCAIHGLPRPNAD